MGTAAGYTIIPESTIRQHDDTNMRYITRLPYAAASSNNPLHQSNPATDICTLADLSSSPPKYSTTMQDDGYRVGQGGMAPKGGIYWSPPNSPKTAELQQQRQQQHKTWKMEQQQGPNAEGIIARRSSNDGGEEKPKRRRFRKLLRKLSSSGSSSEE